MIEKISAAEIARRVTSGTISCEEVANAFLDRIEANDADLHCFLAVDRERILKDAHSVQNRIAKGESLALAGLPLAVKDNISTSSQRTTCASRILENYTPPYDATAIRKLKAAGAIVLGKTNLDEFAMGTSTENSAFGPTRNPWDKTRSPGGSSGGSAAAVAAGLAPLALGSDTGGSIRQPAALCGVVGFKPTYGRVSRYGLIAFASSLDQVGPFGRTVADAALLASVISGHDPADSTSLPAPPIEGRFPENGTLKGVRIGLPRELWGGRNHHGALARCEETVRKLEAEGADLREITLPSIAYGVTTYYIIAPAEASSNLARFDGIRFGSREEGKGHIEVVESTRGRLFGHEVKTRLMMGTYALSAGYYDAYYGKAQEVRSRMSSEFDAAFEDLDFIASPTSPIPAFRLGELSDDPMALKLLDYCTIPANLGGYPAISIPCGLADGLPVGFQLMAARMQDDALLTAAHVVECILGEPPWPPMP